MGVRSTLSDALGDGLAVELEGEAAGLLVRGAVPDFEIKGGTLWESQPAVNPVASNSVLNESVSSLPSATGTLTTTFRLRLPARAGEQYDNR